MQRDDLAPRRELPHVAPRQREPLAELLDVAQVVAVEDGVRQVAGDLHGVVLVHAAAPEVRRRGVARVVEDVAAGLPTDGEAGSLAGGLPRLLEVAEAAIALGRRAPRLAVGG